MPVPMPCLWPCAVPCGTALLAHALSIAPALSLPSPPVASVRKNDGTERVGLHGFSSTDESLAGAATGTADTACSQRITICWRLPTWHAQMQHRHTNRAPAMTECTVITCARARRWSTPRNPCVRDPRPTPRPMLPQGERWAALRTARKP